MLATPNYKLGGGTPALQHVCMSMEASLLQSLIGWNGLSRDPFWFHGA